MSSQTVQPGNTEAAILARLIKAKREMDPYVARYFLSVDFEQDDVDRMNFLAQRAQQGTLSPEETAELDSYLHVGNLLSIMQSKARIYLNAQDRSPSTQ